MWFENSVMYQIYPIGFCGAPRKNGGEELHLLGEIEKIIPHLVDMGINAVLLNPVLKSESHGYDTLDFVNVDNRLGTNEEFKSLVDAFHKSGIKVIYDAVFNHVGRGYPAFQDVLKNRQNSRYVDWFYIDFGGNSRYNDGFSYMDWEGCAELVKLNLENAEVQDVVFGAVKTWIEEYGIDGLRLDAARHLPNRFIKKLKAYCLTFKPEFPLISEVIRIHEYVSDVADGTVDSLTDYECFTGMISSINQPNFFEIAHSIERNFARGGLFHGKYLLNFLDNHDVTRAATAIKDERNLKVAYALMFALQGVPCVYYGSEFGQKGDNKNGDEPLRPAYSDVDKSDDSLVKIIKSLADVRKRYTDSVYGEYEKLYLDNTVYAFARGKVIYAFNVTDEQKTLRANGREIKIDLHGFTVICGDQTLAF